MYAAVPARQLLLSLLTPPYNALFLKARFRRLLIRNALLRVPALFSRRLSRMRNFHSPGGTFFMALAAIDREES